MKKYTQRELVNEVAPWLARMAGKSLLKKAFAKGEGGEPSFANRVARYIAPDAYGVVDKWKRVLTGKGLGGSESGKLANISSATQDKITDYLRDKGYSLNTSKRIRTGKFGFKEVYNVPVKDSRGNEFTINFDSDGEVATDDSN